MSDVKKKHTLLIVDDAPENIAVLKGLLEKEYDLKAATNGKTALAIAKTGPDLILLDIVMPEMNGYQVCQGLHGAEETKNIPVIFVTGNSEEEQITQGFEVGGVDYVTKPYNPKELLARVKTHLELSDHRKKMALLAENLGKYLSPTLYRSIFEGKKEVAIGTSRKPLTVFFSDIVKFTPKVEAMPVDEVTSWINGYLNRMAEITIAHGGTLDKFIGDSVMVFFGDPQTEGPEKDAIKCLKMAKEMIQAAKEMAIDIRIGISSGDIMVGNFGSDNHMEYSILGREVNVASRLESHCEPNRILMSDRTKNLVDSEIASTLRGEIQVKGIDRSILAWWVD